MKHCVVVGIDLNIMVFIDVHFFNRQKSRKTSINCPKDRQKLDTDKVNGFKGNYWFNTDLNELLTVEFSLN